MSTTYTIVLTLPDGAPSPTSARHLGMLLSAWPTASLDELHDGNMLADDYDAEADQPEDVRDGATAAIVCDGCGRSTLDPDRWDPEAGTGRVLCDSCWPTR